MSIQGNYSKNGFAFGFLSLSLSLSLSLCVILLLFTLFKIPPEVQAVPGTLNITASTGSNLFPGGAWTSSGNVGIGTTNPTLGKLVTTGMVGNTSVVFSSDQQGISLIASDPIIGFNTYYNGGFKAINTGGASYIDGAGGNIQFANAPGVTGQGTAQSFTERMRIDTTGNVGIGTTAPGMKLDVGTIASDYIRSYGGFTGNAVANIQGTGAAAYFPNGLYAQGANEWIYGTVTFNGALSGATSLSVSGNLTLTPANPSITSGGSYITIPNGLYVSGGTPYFQTQIQARGGIANDSATYLTLAGGTTGISYFSGNVGIGTTGPTEKLDVAGNILAENSGTSSVGGGYQSVASFTQKFNTNYWNSITGQKTILAGGIYGITTTSNVNPDPVTRLTLQGGTADVLSVLSSGNVGIGTTGPGQKLSVAGTIESTSGGFKFPDATTQTSAGITGSGTTNYVTKWTGTSSTGNSSITDDGTTATFNGSYVRGATYGFGGFYSVWGCGWGAQTNPFTGGYSCPSGFSSYTFTAANWAGGACNANLNVSLCYK